jgi:6-pyruvoyltetrahydropterin/6-carboxytetrahydropterin synthase
MNIRITKRFEFELAHALTHHQGMCKGIHGHSYKLEVTVLGQPKSHAPVSDSGMVADFSEIKSIVNKLVVHPYDHALVMTAEYLKRNNIEQITSQKLILFDEEPTCENMLIKFVGDIQKEMPVQLRLISVKLMETSSSWAEWRAEDN